MHTIYLPFLHFIYLQYCYIFPIFLFANCNIVYFLLSLSPLSCKHSCIGHKIYSCFSFFKFKFVSPLLLYFYFLLFLTLTVCSAPAHSPPPPNHLPPNSPYITYSCWFSVALFTLPFWLLAISAKVRKRSECPPLQ